MIFPDFWTQHLDPSFILTLQEPPVDVLVLRFSQSWILVEQIGHKGQVEFGVPAHHVSRGDKLSTAEPVGLLQHRLRPFQVVSLLINTHRQGIRSGVTAQLLE